MAKRRTVHRCLECGATVPRWTGQCHACGAWGTLNEELDVSEDASKGVAKGVAKGISGGAGALDVLGEGFGDGTGDVPVPLVEVGVDDARHRATGIDEFDRVLGGGLVPGGTILLGGEPGVGKSTLVLQALQAVAARGGGRTLLVTAEESREQVRLRGDRLGTLHPGVHVVAEERVPAVVEHLRSLQPTLAVVDSIQTVRDTRIESAAGSVVQVRESASALVDMARAAGVTLVLVGHVTKDGALAGPRVLEHLVDVVLQFDGDRHHSLRTLRAMKNRFGPTGEVGLFEMSDRGLVPLADPSGLFLAGRRAGAPGSTVVAAIEGRRPVLVEVQALSAPPHGGPPRRSVTGLEPNRVNVLSGVLEKRLGLDCARSDLYVSVAGGVRLNDPALDLGLCLAIASSCLGDPVPAHAVSIGEVGLAGEVRAVPALERRILEALRFGFTSILVPASAADTAHNIIQAHAGEAGAGDGRTGAGRGARSTRSAGAEVMVVPVSDVGEAVRCLVRDGDASSPSDRTAPPVPRGTGSGAATQGPSPLWPPGLLPPDPWPPNMASGGQASLHDRLRVVRPPGDSTKDRPPQQD